MIAITLNGKPQTVSKDTNLSTLIDTFSKQPRHVLAELNGIIINREQWTQTPLKEADSLELVTFVGGG